MESKFTISNSSEDEKDYLGNMIDEFNNKEAAFTQSPIFESINFIVKNNKNEIIGGINSDLYYWNILFISILWVHDDYRHKGIGSQLMLKVERAAKQKNCTLVHLDTFSFQAKDFYLKQGFEIFGILEGYPGGHKRYYMKKNI